MRRTTIAVIVLAVAACAFAAPAMAHQGDPRFDSVLTGTGVPGLKVQVLNYGDRLLLQNRTGKTVTLQGYENEPYARLLPDGTVQVNQRSPATYLNDDPYANATVPKTADAKAAPVWKTIEGDNRYETHDHRIHWMSPGTVPEKVTDQNVRTRVFNWSVPVQVGDAKPTAITGTLWWRGKDAAGGMPVGAIAGLGGLVLVSIAFVVIVRRRRSRGDRAPAESAEAW
jgi:hypothetical protein